MIKNKIQCLIVDDEHLGRDLIAAHLKELKQFEVVAMCSNAIEASQFLNENHVDLMFLDIEMPVLKGTEFYKSLSHKPQVIFTTAHRNYALDGFELEAVDYLLKPITFPRFFKAIERYLSIREKPITVPNVATSDHLFVRVNRKAVKVNFSEIKYIQGLKDYIVIHTVHGKLTVKDSMTAFLSKLNPEFIRVHRSYIVNQTHISAYTKHDVEIGEIEIPIGETYIKTTLASLQ